MARTLYVDTVDKLNDGTCMYNGTLTVLKLSHPEWRFPLRWKGADRPIMGDGKPSLLWSGSMAEIFLPERPKWIVERLVPRLAASDDNIIALLLTKCPDVMAQYFLAQHEATRRQWRRKFWLGFSAENQRWFDQRWPPMRALAEDGFLTFVSVAPCVGPVTLPVDFLRLAKWVIVSGEQGPHEHCRDMDPAWARALLAQCAAALPFFLKQMARKAPIPPDLQIWQFPDAD